MIENIAYAVCASICTFGLCYVALAWYFKGMWR